MGAFANADNMVRYVNISAPYRMTGRAPLPGGNPPLLEPEGRAKAAPICAGENSPAVPAVSAFDDRTLQQA
jgi:hypothetical protein